MAICPRRGPTRWTTRFRSDRAMKHLRKPTIPIAPWEIPDATGDEWDFTPEERQIEREWHRVEIEREADKSSTEAQNSVDDHCIGHIAPRPSDPASALIGRVFMGRLNVSDLDYMAKAILQMADENHELRERVRKLEEALGL